MLGRVAGNRGITWVMLGAVALSVYGLWWALPSITEPDPDSSVPLTTLRGAACGFANGWVGQHQPLQPMIIATLSAPYLGYLLATGGLDRHAVKRAYPYGLKDPLTSLSVVILIGRALSALSYLALVWILYKVGLVMRNETAGVILAALGATCYPFVYYAHVGNPDMLYTALMGAALLAYLLCLREPTVSNVAVLASTAALSASVKFQALPFVAGMVPAVVHVALKGAGPVIENHSPRASGRWRALLMGLVIFVATFAAANNLMFNAQGFARWFAEKHRGVGVIRLNTAMAEKNGTAPVFAVAAGRNLVAGTGLPVLVLAVAGICIGVCTDDWVTFALVPPFAAAAAFFWTVQAEFIRYMFPCMLIVLVLAALGADGLREWLYGMRFGGIGAAAAGALLFGFLGARAVEITWLMTHGSRYQAERWIASHAGTASFTVEMHQAMCLRLPRAARLDAYDPFTYFAGQRGATDPHQTMHAVRTYGPGVLDAKAVLQRAPDLVVLWPGAGRDDKLIGDLQRPGTGYARVAEFAGSTRLISEPFYANIPIVIFQRTAAARQERPRPAQSKGRTG